jgi:hypothetical protein
MAHAYQVSDRRTEVKPLRSEPSTPQGLKAYGMRLEAAANAYRRNAPVESPQRMCPSPLALTTSARRPLAMVPGLRYDPATMIPRGI